MPQLIAVVGATATGKTSLGVALARALNGEIIGADSRQIYRGMAVGTAQPNAAELTAAPHHLFGFHNPDQPFGLATYLDLARAAIADIRRRGKQPIIVGGTGQYVWALLEEWTVPRVPPDVELRRELEAFAAERGAEALHARLRTVDPAAAGAIHPNNVRRVIRALEVHQHTGRAISAHQTRNSAEGALVIGLRLTRPELYARIDRRVEAMYAGGLLEEVRALAAAGYGRVLPSMASIGYPEAWAVLAGELALAAAIERTQQRTHRFARQQHAWFPVSDRRIRWLDAAEPVDSAAAQALKLVQDWQASPGITESQDAIYEDARHG